jgi:hypothetical protein
MGFEDQDQIESAHKIAGFLLEQTGNALVSGDFEKFVKYFHLPQEMETFEGLNLVSTPAELRKVFDAIRLMFQREGITQLVRHIVEARYTDENTIKSTHETRLLNGTTLVQQPFPTFSTLSRREGWQVKSAQYAIADSPQYNAALLGRTKPRDPNSPKEH